MDLPTALQGGDLVSALVDWLPPLVAILAILAAMMWVLAYASRVFEYLKMQESRWMDRGTLDVIYRLLASVWIVFTALLVLLVLQFRAPFVKDALLAIVRRLPAAFLVVFILFAAIVMTRVLHRFSSYLRGEHRTKPKHLAVSRAFSAAEVATKYAIYLVAVVTALVGGAQALPSEDQPLKDAVAAFVAPAKWAQAVALLVGAVVALLVVDRLAISIFKDVRHRSQRFNARVLDRLQSAARIALALLVSSIALFLLLAVIGLSAEQLLIATIGYIGFLLTGALIVSDSARDALSGITLMMSDPFEVGDHVKVGDDLVGKVVAVNLTHTQVRTLKGDLVHVPNSRLLRETVANFSRSKTHPVIVEVAVEFAVPHERVEALVRAAVAATPGIDAEAPPEFFGKDLADGCIHYQLVAFTQDPERVKQIRSDLIFRIQDGFRREGVHPKPTP